MTDSHETNHAAGPGSRHADGVRPIIELFYTGETRTHRLDMHTIKQMDLDECVDAINYLLAVAQVIRDAHKGLQFMAVLDNGRGWELQPTVETVDQLIKHYRQKLGA
ncbi:hypothetical protein AZ09_08190 [Acetobacter aceti 1023]|nr:hypothetical protein AZ09_08190 [Acetobacter aceti 1023]